MNLIKCKFCGAAVDSGAVKCPSCGASTLLRSNLAEKDIENLTNYIISVENALKLGKKRADGKILISFFLLSAIWMISSYALYRYMRDDLKIVIIFTIVFGMVIFFAFGAFVGKYEFREMEFLFNRKIKNDIIEYLNLMQYSKADFKIVAGRALNENSCLNDFILDI